ncbi:MAG TPA: hypothetical protein V6C65_19415 [Allocoleopsis sp.]
MQLNDLHKPIEEMSDEELRQQLILVRRRREQKTARGAPAPKKVSAKQAKLEALSKDEILAKLKAMGAL